MDGSSVSRSRPGLSSRTRSWVRWLGRSWARWGYARRIEPHWLELTRLTVHIPDLHPAYEGFRIVHLTDFHGSSKLPTAYLDEAVDLANAQKADLVALTGDFIHKGQGHIDQVAATLSRLSAAHGIYAVLGNHDFAVRNALRWGMRRHRGLHNRVADGLHRRGIEVLRNRSLTLERHGGRLHLIGVDDLWSRACDLDQAFSNVAPGPRLLLAHNPMTVEELNGRRCDLILSGHTHGGQINLPRLGRILLGRHGRRFAAGLYRYRSSYLYVNRGIGYGWRLRFGVRPEVAVIQLRSGPEPSSPDPES